MLHAKRLFPKEFRSVFDKRASSMTQEIFPAFVLIPIGM